MEFTSIDKENYPAFRPLLSETEAFLFEKNASWHGIGAIADDTACGILIYEIIGKEENLCHIYYIAVAEDYRRQGIASALLDEISRLGYEHMAYPVCTFMADSYDDAIYGLFAVNPRFSIEEEAGGLLAISYADLKSFLQKHRADSFELNNLNQCLTSSKKEMNQICQENGILLDFSGVQIIKECSLAIEKKGKLNAFLVISRRTDGDYEISYLYSIHQNKVNDMLKLIIESLTRLIGIMNDGEKLHINVANPKIEKLIEYLADTPLTYYSRYYTASFDGL